MSTTISLSNAEEAITIEHPYGTFTILFKPKGEVQRSSLLHQSSNFIDLSSIDHNGYSNGYSVKTGNGNGTSSHHNRSGVILEPNNDVEDEGIDPDDDFVVSHPLPTTVLPVEDMKMSLPTLLLELRPEILQLAKEEIYLTAGFLHAYYRGAISVPTLKRMMSWLVLEGSLAPGVKCNRASTWVLTHSGEELLNDQTRMERQADQTYAMTRVYHALSPRKDEKDEIVVAFTTTQLVSRVRGEPELSEGQVREALITMSRNRLVDTINSTQGMGWFLTKKAVI